MIQANDLKGSTPSNVTREPMFIRWWLLFVHKKAASYPIYKAFSSQSCIFSYIYTHICKLRKIGPPSRIHNTWLRKRMKNEERSHPEAQYQKDLEGIWNDVSALNRFARANVLRQLFPFNEIMYFQKFILVFLHVTFHFQSGSSITIPTLYTKNEWPNFKEYILVVEEEEWEENNIRKFIKLIRTTWTSLETR